jgi:hypothetical protein
MSLPSIRMISKLLYLNPTDRFGFEYIAPIIVGGTGESPIETIRI